ncbi:MAG: hypothetical protein RI957_1360 [Verrucomicrobiota bacterium]|jgi:hypothetical protein
MEKAKPSLELRDIPDVTPLLPREWWPWWVWLALAASALLLWFLASMMRHRSNHHRSLRREAYEQALQSLESSKALEHAVSRCTALSLALRRYLAVAFADPSLYETHEELLARHQAFAELPDSLRHALGEYFSTLCRYKYAPCEEAVDLSLLIPQATTLLQQIHAVDPRPAPAAS